MGCASLNYDHHFDNQMFAASVRHIQPALQLFGQQHLRGRGNSCLSGYENTTRSDHTGDSETCALRLCWQERHYLPHGGVRPFRQKSTCLHTINLDALGGVNVVTPPQKNFGDHETLVRHQAEYNFSDTSAAAARRESLDSIQEIIQFKVLQVLIRP